MGTTQSSPFGGIRNQRNFDYLGQRDSIAYSTSFGAVRFRSNCNSKRNSVEKNSRPTSYTASTSTSKKKASLLASSWNFAKRTASSAVPSFLNSSSNRSSLSLASKDSAKRSSNSSQSKEKSNKKLDDLNCNSLRACPAWELADRHSTNISYTSKPIEYSRNRSQDSLNLFNCKPNYDDQDLNNNNYESPQRMQNFIHSMGQFSRKRNNRSGKLAKNNSSLSTNSSEFSSNTASTESTSSFSAYNVNNLSVQTKQLYLNHEEYSDEEEEIKAEPCVNSILRPSYSQQSFLSPSELFDNGVNGNVFGRNMIINLSTSDLLLGLGKFVSRNCRVNSFEPASLVMWLRSVDRALMIQGWQDIAFLNAANLVFVYLLIREQLAREYDNIRTLSELQSLVCCCLYVAYSYLGNEISYPLKPFITQHECRAKFWSRCLELINLYSEDMLQINQSSEFFLQLFHELEQYAEI